MARITSSGTLYLISVQVASRGLTFIGNQFLLRFLSPELFGIAVQLELLSVMVLYFSRESLRVALQRQPSLPTSPETDLASKRRDEISILQAAVNLSFIAMLIGCLVSPVVATSYLRNAGPQIRYSPYFDQAFIIYATATVIELLAEPSFLIIQQRGLFRARATSETSAAIARCVVSCSTVILMIRLKQPGSVLPFAAGQLGYAVVLLVAYEVSTGHIYKELGFSHTPRAIDKPPEKKVILKLWPRQTTVLALTLYAQSVFKFLLTQGDAIILSLIASLPDQGSFALASNYGGLLARLVFQPVEESSRNMFGRLLSTKSSEKVDQEPARQSLDYLANIIHFYLVMSLPLMSLGPYILPLIVGSLMGSRWQSPALASVLSTYCYYLPFAAINGVLDAFVTSVATTAQLRTQFLWMILFTVNYAIAAWVFVQVLRLGGTGLVYANILNMFIRSLWSLHFISSWTGQTMPRQCTFLKILQRHAPRWPSITTTLLVAVGMRYLPGQQGPLLDLRTLSRDQFAMIATAIVLVGSSLLISERKFLMETCLTILPRRYAQKLQTFLGMQDSCSGKAEQSPAS